MQGNLVRELRHLDVDTGVNLAAEVRAQHLLVRRILAVLYPERLGVVLALHARGAQRTRKQTDLHAAPGSGVARLVRIALVRPEVESQHPDGCTREKHLLAPRGVELETADEVEASTLDVLDALVKTAVYVVEIPSRRRGHGVQPLFERARMNSVWRHPENVAAAVRCDAHAFRGLRQHEVLLAERVDLLDVVNVEVAIRLDERGKQLGLALLDGEVRVARANRDDLREPVGDAGAGRVQEERVDVSAEKRLHRARARRELHVAARRQPRMLEVARTVVALALRHRRIADLHVRPVPVSQLRRDHLLRALGVRVQREAHLVHRLEREVVLLEKLWRPESGAYHVCVVLRSRRPGAGSGPFGNNPRPLEDLRHYGVGVSHIAGGPDVERGISHAIDDTNCFGTKPLPCKSRCHHGGQSQHG